MTVTAEYAAEHLVKLLSAVDRGERAVIQREDKSLIHMTAPDADVPRATAESRPALFNSWRGKIVLSDDWDSPETNAEIAAEFEASDHDEGLFGTLLKHQA